MRSHTTLLVANIPDVSDTGLRAPFGSACACTTTATHGAYTTAGKAMMRPGLGSACLILAALAPASCFFTGTKGVVPSRISPRASSSSSASAVGMATQAPIAWPDEITMPLADQPIRARIIAVAPGDVASPFNDRGKSVPWYEVRFVKSPACTCCSVRLLCVPNCCKTEHCQASLCHRYVAPRVAKSGLNTVSPSAAPLLMRFLQVWDHIATRVKFCDTGVDMEVRVLALLRVEQAEACATKTVDYVVGFS